MVPSLATTALPLHYCSQSKQRSRWLSQLTELIAFPTISAQPKHRTDIKSCAQWLARHLRVPIVLLGFGLPDDDIHAPNEKMNLPTFFRGIETVIRFIAEYAT